MICSSWPVPRVAVASAWVSPRVKSAEPWLRGSTPHFALDGANVAGGAAVDAHATVQYLAAHDLLLQTTQRAVENAGCTVVVAELCSGLRLGRRHLLQPFGLAGDGVGCAEWSLGARADPLDQRRVHLFLGQLPRLLRARLGEADDGLDHRLDRRVTEGDRTKHLLLGELGRLRFDHEHTLLGAGHDQIEVGGRALLVGRVEHVGSVCEADPATADRPHEGQARDGKRGRRADHGDDVGIVDQVVREHRADDLGFVTKRLDEEGPERPIDQAGDQGLLLARAPFALEEAARDLAGG